jgi:Transposase IS116/IS110/IS902 family
VVAVGHKRLKEGAKPVGADQPGGGNRGRGRHDLSPFGIDLVVFPSTFGGVGTRGHGRWLPLPGPFVPSANPPRSWKAWAWLGEIGPAPHQWFSSHQKLASWVSLCPGNNISAGKRKHGRTGDAGTYIKPVLIQAAWAAIRVRGRLQARYNRLVRRFGGDKNPSPPSRPGFAAARPPGPSFRVSG